MSNQHDEIKKLIKASRDMQNKDNLVETRNILINKGLIKEMEEIETTKEDKQKTYRISGGLLTLHGKDTQEIEISSTEKQAFQETMDEFVDEVSDMTEFGTLNVFPTNVDWSGKILDFDIEFYYSIGENNGTYINGDMIKLDDNLIELINALQSYYEKFKSKWARIVSEKKKTDI